MKASLNRERCRKHGLSEDEARDKEEDDNKSPMRSPPDLGMAVSMAGERSSAGKDDGGGEATGEICA